MHRQKTEFPYHAHYYINDQSFGDQFCNRPRKLLEALLSYCNDRLLLNVLPIPSMELGFDIRLYLHFKYALAKSRTNADTVCQGKMKLKKKSTEYAGSPLPVTNLTSI